MRKALAPALGAALCALAPIAICAAPVARKASTPSVPARAATPASVALRGYGAVSASFAPNRVQFRCESIEKADLLLGKLLADLFWDAGVAHTSKTVRLGNASLVVHQQAGYGALVAARSGVQVLVIGARDEASLLQAASREPLLKAAGTKFAPSQAYPMYLDFYDLRALKFYSGGLDSPSGIGWETHWPFVKKFGLGGLTLQAPSTPFSNPAPGVISWIDSAVRVASQEGGMIVPSLWTGGEVALWMRNDYPNSMMQPAPSGLLGAWNGAGPAGASFLSWGLPKAQADATIGQFARQVVNRYKDSPSVGGWHLYAGSPGAEMGFHERTTEMWDYSLAGQEGFRQWLRDERGLSLQQLGARWYGDPNRFQSWSQVSLPDIRTFFGDLDNGALRLRDNWKWRTSDPTQTSEQAPDSGAKDWIPVAMPPSQEQALLPWGAAFYRTSFNASDWTKGKEGRDVFLTVDVNTRRDEGTQVWLNNKYLGAFKARTAPGPFEVKVSGLVRAGENELILRVPSGRDNLKSDGKLFGPVALTTTPPRLYPFLGREANARWVDLRQWQAYGIYRSHVLAAQAVRAVDPNRSLILSAAHAELGTFNNELAVRFGMGTQFTGREAWYFPWNARSGIVGGFYGTSEPSATARGTNLDRMIGWALLDGDSNVDMFWNIEDYIRQEKESGWFSKNQSLLRLIGKSLPEPPPIVILHSAVTTLMGSEGPMNLDIGRGELHAAHYDYGYATERELKNGDVRAFPVLFDGGSEIMAESTIRDIEAYVRAGGTFIAQRETGRHTLEEPDAYPISRISGWKVAKSNQSGKIRFAKYLTLFKGWENREFNDDGLALESNPAAPGAVALARWADGSVAVGSRAIGKGRIITLGSSFWRSHNADQSAFFERLFSDLGVRRNTNSQPDIWTRKVNTKNGLQSWLIALNNGAPREADVSFRVAWRPAQVLDMIANKPVQFSYADGWVKVAGAQFAEHGTRVFGVKCADLANGLPLWWAEKTRYWRKSEGGSLPAAVPNTRTVVFDKWKFQTDEQNKIAASTHWMQPTFSEVGWRDLQTGIWNLQHASLKNYGGAALYRARFTLPAAWKGRTVSFNMFSFHNPVLHDKAEFFLNGQKVTEYQARMGSQTLNYDVTNLLRQGENVLAIKVVGGAKQSGITGSLWLEPERELSTPLDLSGAWQAVGGDYLSRREVVLPGGTQAKYIEREVAIPASWSGRDVFVHIEVPGGQWMKSVVVNGHPITYNSFLHPFGLRTEINISPFVRFGAPNRIQIWPWNTIGIQNHANEAPEDRLDISRIYLGVQQK